jgi:hypothetical protein
MSNTPSKIKRVTECLVLEPLDFITAAQKANDRSLHSTVSSIQSKWGIKVFRRRIKRPGYRGIPTACCEYRILPNQFEKARNALELMR